eukprot:CAMPEP_0196725038 /NCGR_PEP_ID=MMETSP1091-20130531/6710_1 /TAXON_ID=302021 /ORGANISM="Rhodomonas sp., Strain CCMP768" /LENGTH=60 /DNA_ID=CAMNT_0042067255 /DNA_START=77 /DNA_END=256 /DNA_ORIENTATION=+
MIHLLLVPSSSCPHARRPASNASAACAISNCAIRTCSNSTPSATRHWTWALNAGTSSSLS